MRDTSIDAYRKILADGTITRSQKDVYECLYHHGPLTGREVNARVHEGAHKRLSELLDRGVVRTVGTRKCSISGQNSTQWDVTSLQDPYPKPPSTKGKRRIDAAKEERLKELLRLYTQHFAAKSCGCGTHGRDRCLYHQALDALDD